MLRNRLKLTPGFIDLLLREGVFKGAFPDLLYPLLSSYLDMLRASKFRGGLRGGQKSQPTDKHLN